MKLLDLTPYFHKKSGGIKSFILKKVDYLPKYEVQHVVVIPGKERKKYMYGSTVFYEVPSFHIPFSGGYRFFSGLKEIKEIIRQEKPDIVELGGTYTIAPFFADKDYLLSIFYHSDAKKELGFIPSTKYMKERFFSLLIDRCISKADLVISPSEKYSQSLMEKINKVYTCPLGVDTKIFNPSKRDESSFRKKFNIQEETILLYVGRLTVEKRIDILMSAIEQLDKKLYHLLIVGSGPLKLYVKAKSKILKNVTFIDYVTSQEELSYIYSNCHMFVSASKYETFGLAFLEAQSSGLPVVAFDLNLETQLLKDFLAKDFTVEALAHAISIAREKLNPTIREYLHTKVRSLFSWESSFDTYMSIYMQHMSLV